jgi:uncharacterized protein (UPF0261 family)
MDSPNVLLLDEPTNDFDVETLTALDAPGKPFHDLTARAALFTAIEQTVRATASRQIIRLPHHINAPEFAAVLVASFHSLHGASRPNRRKEAMP